MGLLVLRPLEADPNNKLLAPCEKIVPKAHSSVRIELANATPIEMMLGAL